MPKLVDYGARFHFLREAAFAVVRDQGTGALSRRSIASRLGVSPSSVLRLVDPGCRLEELAAQEVVRRRRGRWLWGRTPAPDADPVQAACNHVARQLPSSPEQIVEEIVWLRLTLAAVSVPDDPPPPHEQGGLRFRFHVAEHGFPAEHDAPAPDPGPASDAEHVRRALRSQLVDRDLDLMAIIDQALRLLGLDETRRAAETEPLRALLDGLTLALSTARIDAETASAVLRGHLDRIRPG